MVFRLSIKGDFRAENDSLIVSSKKVFGSRLIQINIHHKKRKKSITRPLEGMTKQ